MLTGSSGVKDLGVVMFFEAIPDERFPEFPRLLKHPDFGASSLGRRRMTWLRRLAEDPAGQAAHRADGAHRRGNPQARRPDRRPAVSRLADFLLTRQGRRVSADTLRDELRRAAAEAGLDGVVPHQLRHTYATALEGGTPVEQIADILGHQSVRSTGVYLKSSLGLLARCALDPDAPAREVSR